MNDSTEHRTRLADATLQAFAGQGDDRAARSVIIEVQAPPVRVAQRGVGPARAIGLGVVTPDGAAERARLADQGMSRVLAWLAQAGVTEPPTPLPGALAVVAQVNPSQLRGLLQLPEVAQIRPNRTLSRRSA